MLPLDAGFGAASDVASKQGLAASFYNTIHDSETCSELLLALAKNGAKPGFAFSAAGFARLGECPFRVSFKKKLHRFIDQLDVADCLADGTPQAPAEGHAEIKELVSRLRCAGFSGRVVLGAENRAAGLSLTDAASRLVDLLGAL